jgi:hypothetical protein
MSNKQLKKLPIIMMYVSDLETEIIAQIKKVHSAHDEPVDQYFSELSQETELFKVSSFDYYDYITGRYLGGKISLDDLSDDISNLIAEMVIDFSLLHHPKIPLAPQK